MSKLQCFFGIGGRFGNRCQNPATHISTFQGEDCVGEDGPMCWCKDHGPATRAFPPSGGHGHREVTDTDHAKNQS